MSRRTVLVHAGIGDASMWDGFELPSEVLRHQLPAPLDETVEKLVLMDAPLIDHEFSEEFMEYVHEEERLIDGGDMDAAVELNLRFWCPGIAERVRPMAAATLEYENEELPNPDLGAATMPTLVAVGEHDKPDFIAIAERLARELPDTRLEVIPGAGHLPPLERPEATAALVREFLAT